MEDPAGPIRFKLFPPSHSQVGRERLLARAARQFRKGPALTLIPFPRIPWVTSRLGGWSELFLLVFLAATFATPSPAADWTDCRVAGPLVCRADFSLTPYEPLLAELAQLQLDLVRQLGIPPAAEPIEVYLFHDQATYARYVSRCVPGAPYRRAIYAKGRGPGRVFAYRGEQFETDLRHECTHALLHAALPSVPLWLDEGLAGCFELPADQRAFDNPHLAAVCAELPTRSRAVAGGVGKEGRTGRDGANRIPRRLGVGPLHALRAGPRAAGVDRLSGRPSRSRRRQRN